METAAPTAVMPPLVLAALAFAFVSGLTSLGYQTVWNRLLSSGTGNSTYVFALILAVVVFAGAWLIFDDPKHVRCLAVRPGPEFVRYNLTLP